MIFIGPDPHTILSRAFEKCTIGGRKPAIVKSRLSRLHSKSRTIRLIFVFLAVPLMVFDIWLSALRQSPVVIREFWNIPIAFVSPIIWPVRHKLYFNINHNLSGLPNRFPLSLYIMALLGFRFVLFDGSATASHFPAKVLRAFYFPLFPCIPGEFQHRTESLPMIAVVGDFRPEKGDPKLIRSLVEALSDDSRWTLKIGKHGNKPSLFEAHNNIVVVDTSTHSDYLRFLSSAVAILVFADADKYYVRHSGTVMDAIACGAVPIVPNLPVIASQVHCPIDVGVIYDDFSELKACATKAISLQDIFSVNRKTYFKFRDTVELTEVARHD